MRSRRIPDFGLFGQVLLIVLFMQGYFAARTIVEDDGIDARANARSILDFEAAIGLDFERAWNSFILDHDVLSSLATVVYVWGYWVSVLAALVFLWFRRRSTYRVLRDALALSAVIGIGFFLLFPVAPPRALDGFTDTVYGGAGGPGRDPPGGTNAFAAFPSYHVGWPAVAGIAVAMTTRRPSFRLLALLPAALLALTVIVTANHYVVDIIGGVAICVFCLWASITAEKRLSWRAGASRLRPRHA